uniref:Uncharacterized protein n=1 Tax=Kalmanozyma brasiliensis (strain GHG001) TaxID=1365824 RepID=V5EUG7_KALBG
MSAYARQPDADEDEFDSLFDDQSLLDPELEESLAQAEANYSASQAVQQPASHAAAPNASFTFRLEAEPPRPARRIGTFVQPPSKKQRLDPGPSNLSRVAAAYREPEPDQVIVRNFRDEEFADNDDEQWWAGNHALDQVEEEAIRMSQQMPTSQPHQSNADHNQDVARKPQRRGRPSAISEEPPDPITVTDAAHQGHVGADTEELEQLRAEVERLRTAQKAQEETVDKLRQEAYRKSGEVAVVRQNLTKLNQENSKLREREVVREQEHRAALDRLQKDQERRLQRLETETAFRRVEQDTSRRIWPSSVARLPPVGLRDVDRRQESQVRAGLTTPTKANRFGIRGGSGSSGNRQRYAGMDVDREEPGTPTRSAAKPLPQFPRPPTAATSASKAKAFRGLQNSFADFGPVQEKAVESLLTSLSSARVLEPEEREDAFRLLSADGSGGAIEELDFSSATMHLSHAIASSLMVMAGVLLRLCQTDLLTDVLRLVSCLVSTLPRFWLDLECLQTDQEARRDEMAFLGIDEEVFNAEWAQYTPRANARFPVLELLVKHLVDRRFDMAESEWHHLHRAILTFLTQAALRSADTLIVLADSAALLAALIRCLSLDSDFVWLQSRPTFLLPPRMPTYRRGSSHATPDPSGADLVQATERIVMDVRLLNLLYNYPLPNATGQSHRFEPSSQAQERMGSISLANKLDQPETYSMLNGIRQSFVVALSRIAFCSEPDWIATERKLLVLILPGLRKEGQGEERVREQVEQSVKGLDRVSMLLEAIADVAGDLVDIVLSPEEIDSVYELLVSEEDEEMDVDQEDVPRGEPEKKATEEDMGSETESEPELNVDRGAGGRSARASKSVSPRKGARPSTSPRKSGVEEVDVIEIDDSD